MSHEWVNTIIAALALVVSLAAFLKSSKDSSRANDISGQNLKLTHSKIEIDLQNMIRDAKRRVEDIFSKNADFLAKPKAGLSADEQMRRERLKIEVDAAIEGYLNALDSACRKHLDPGKIDQDWFKREQQVEIRQAVEDKAHSEFFHVGHKFHALMEVYDQWENPEKNRAKRTGL